MSLFEIMKVNCIKVNTYTIHYFSLFVTKGQSSRVFKNAYIES